MILNEVFDNNHHLKTRDHQIVTLVSSLQHYSNQNTSLVEFSEFSHVEKVQIKIDVHMCITKLKSVYRFCTINVNAFILFIQIHSSNASVNVLLYDGSVYLVKLNRIEMFSFLFIKQPISFRQHSIIITIDDWCRVIYLYFVFEWLLTLIK